jgi:hypothetical protein
MQCKDSESIDITAENIESVFYTRLASAEGFTAIITVCVLLAKLVNTAKLSSPANTFCSLKLIFAAGTSQGQALSIRPIEQVPLPLMTETDENGDRIQSPKRCV